jgi:hypothetical protein
LRTGPLVRRRANASRAARMAPSTSRPSSLPQILSRPLLSLTDSEAAPAESTESSGRYLECRLPIGLRHFLAEQLGPALKPGDDAIVHLAAHADQATLSKLARAIRHYSMTRAHEPCAECAVALACLVPPSEESSLRVTLCLHCARLDFGDDAALAHQGPKCLAVTLDSACNGSGGCSTGAARETDVAHRIQRLVEEFRALRAAFGLSHFELDCYVRGNEMTFNWRPPC